MRCYAFSALSYNGFGPARTFQEVLRSFDDEGLEVSAFSPRLRVRPDNAVKQIQGLSPILRSLPWKHIARHGVARTESRLLDRVLRDSERRCVYTFPDMSPGTIRLLAQAGVPIIREMTNLHRGTARRILSEAYEAEGLPPYSAIDRDSVELETQCLVEMDYVFAPNAEVEKSLVEFGVDQVRILGTSYGWSKARYAFVDEPRKRETGTKLTALYVGRISYEKGCHHLLRAWSRAGYPGKLVLAGSVEPLFRERMNQELNHDSIELLGFVADMSKTYASANYLIFPSLVEGGPQVVYEAGAHGLALIVSPMGAGRMVPDSAHGAVIDTGDIDAFADAITYFVENPELTFEIGRNARKRAERFEWSEVSRHRARLMIDALGGGQLSERYQPAAS